MKNDPVKDHLPESCREHDDISIELTMEDVASVAGGPQVTNDEVVPPPAVAPMRS